MKALVSSCDDDFESGNYLGVKLRKRKEETKTRKKKKTKHPTRVCLRACVRAYVQDVSSLVGYRLYVDAQCGQRLEQ